jgi:hypothetical protein
VVDFAALHEWWDHLCDIRECSVIDYTEQVRELVSGLPPILALRVSLLDKSSWPQLFSKTLRTTGISVAEDFASAKKEKARRIAAGEPIDLVGMFNAHHAMKDAGVNLLLHIEHAGRGPTSFYNTALVLHEPEIAGSVLKVDAEAVLRDACREPVRARLVREGLFDRGGSLLWGGGLDVNGPDFEDRAREIVREWPQNYSWADILFAEDLFGPANLLLVEKFVRGGLDGQPIVGARGPFLYGYARDAGFVLDWDENRFVKFVYWPPKRTNYLPILDHAPEWIQFEP